MKKNILALSSLLAAAGGIGGCAVQADPQAMREEPVYITGSNIARRHNAGEVSVMNADAFERARSAVNPPIPVPAGGGH